MEKFEGALAAASGLSNLTLARRRQLARGQTSIGGISNGARDGKRNISKVAGWAWLGAT